MRCCSHPSPFLIVMENYSILGTCAVIAREGSFKYILVFYSIAPIIYSAYIVVRDVVTWHMSFVIKLLLFSLLSIELGLKNFLGEKRPLGSCEIGYGFPSGHSVVSMIFFLHAVVDLYQQESPWTSKKSMWLVFYCLLWLPVPPSRYFVLAHTFPQIIAGVFLGIAIFTFGHFLRTCSSKW